MFGKHLFNRFRPKSKNASNNQPAAPIEDISDSSTEISFRMPLRTALEYQPSLLQRSRFANVLNDARRAIDSDSSRIQEREDADSNDDYTTDFPFDGTDNNNNHNNRSEGVSPRVRHPTIQPSTISAHTYEILRIMNEETPGGNDHHALQSVGSESAGNVCESLDLRSDRTGNRGGYPDPEEHGSQGRSRTTLTFCTLCQNHFDGSAPEEERGPSRNDEVNENSPSSLRSDSSGGTRSNYNPVYPHIGRRLPPPPPPPPPQMPQQHHRQQHHHQQQHQQQQQQQQQPPPVGPSFGRRTPSMGPLRSEDSTDRIPYYRETGFSNDAQAMIINISGPISINTQSFTVGGGQLNSPDPDMALDGLERPLQKTFYKYINHACQRYLLEQQMGPSARGEPSSS